LKSRLGWDWGGPVEEEEEEEEEEEHVVLLLLVEFLKVKVEALLRGREMVGFLREGEGMEWGKKSGKEMVMSSSSSSSLYSGRTRILK